MTARGSSASFGCRSASVAGALAAAGTLAGTDSGAGGCTTVEGGLAASARRISATRAHAVVTVSNPATSRPNMIRLVLTEPMVGTSVRYLAFRSTPPSVDKQPGHLN